MPFLLLKEFELNSVELNFEDFIQKQLLLDVQGDLKRNTKDGLCKFFIKGNCAKAIACPYPHNKTGKSIMCKHWLRGLCKKNEDCEFLHEYNLKKMPECFFYQQYRECGNGEDCIFVHIDPESKIRECDWYKRGFCRHGPDCKSRHVRRIACEPYLTGFCPRGIDCQNGHPKNEIPIISDNSNFVKATHDYSQRGNYGRNHGGNFSSNRNTSEVTCYKCNNKGHYANNCPTSMKFRQ